MRTRVSPSISATIILAVAVALVVTPVAAAAELGDEGATPTASPGGSAVAAGRVADGDAATIEAMADGGRAPSADEGGAGSANGTASSSAPVTSVSVSRTDAGAISYDLRLSDLGDVERLWVVVGDSATVTATAGLTRRSGGERTRYRWTGEGPVTLSLTVAGGAANATTAVTDDWAFGPVPFVEVQADTGDSLVRDWPLSRRLVVDATDTGVVGTQYALLGDHDAVTRRTLTGRRLRLVVPAGTEIAAGRGAVLDALAGASRRLNVGDRDAVALGFAVSGVREGGGSVPARDEFWVNADAPLTDPENPWLHEYVHTRQSFTLATNMRWFREASAEYYAARLSYEQGLIERERLHDKLDGPPSDATLTAPASWTDPQTPRRKGARVLAVLDHRIRSATYGFRSLEDVFRRLNDHEGPVTYAEFEQAVSEVAGTSMDGWLDRHVAGSAPVTDAYPTESRFLGAGVVGVTLGPRQSAFVTLSLGLSLVAAVPLYGLLRRWRGTRAALRAR
ncbi:MAG: hypothetical protein ABEJ85_05180 [Haloarculaceae archaeon]